MQIQLEREHLYIDGTWIEPAGSEVIEIVSPHTEEVIGRVPHASAEDVDRAVGAARRAFDQGPWPQTPVAERVRIIRAFADRLEQRGAEVAALVGAEIGAPTATAAAVHVVGAINSYRAAAATGERFEFEAPRDGARGPVIVRHEPVGVVGLIVPWNAPQLTTAAKLGSALVAGCTVVLKPAPETSLDAYVLCEIAEEVGLPPGVLNMVPAGREVGSRLVEHPGVDKISFTGSVPAGRSIMAAAATSLKRVTLELGGKSAGIILPDADLDEVVPLIIGGVFVNSGQACVALSRILVPDSRYDEFAECIVRAARALTIGDPGDPATELGPLATRAQQARVLDHIEVAKRSGATLLTGGGVPADQPRGWYVEPTVFGDVDNQMRIAREEVFGPVLCLLRYYDVDEAVAIANDSDFGLSGAVWGRDVEQGLAIARRIRTGTYSVNCRRSDGTVPFGGFKSSGIGREGGAEGLTSYLETKSISLPAG